MKKTNIIITIFFSIFIIYSLINIKETNTSSLNTITTFSKTILPALLPFLILNQLIIKLGIIDLIAYLFQFISFPLFKISGKGASIIIIGLLNGFPSSAIFTSMMLLDNQIEKEEAQTLINCIFFPSVSFLFAILAKNISDNKLFTILILSIYLSGFILLYISSFKINTPKKLLSFNQTINNIKDKLNCFCFSKNIKDIISNSFSTLINILGIIVIFSIPCNIINKIIPNDISYLLKGLIEFSIPSINLSLSNMNKKSIILTLSIILSFSSLSSIMQANLFINEASLDAKKFFINRILICILTITLLAIFLFFL